MIYHYHLCKLLTPSDGNLCQSTSPRLTTLEEDWELLVDFSSILYLWFQIQGMRTYNSFNWVSNTAYSPFPSLKIILSAHFWRLYIFQWLLGTTPYFIAVGHTRVYEWVIQSNHGMFIKKMHALINILKLHDIFQILMSCTPFILCHLMISITFIGNKIVKWNLILKKNHPVLQGSMTQSCLFCRWDSYTVDR